MKNKFLCLLMFLFVGIVSFTSCEKNEPGTSLTFVGESSAKIPEAGGEFKIGYKVGGDAFRLLTLKLNSGNISFGEDPAGVVSSPVIAAYGKNINSLEQISEKKFENSDLSFLKSVSLNNGDGYLIRLKAMKPGSGVQIQWVIKVLVDGLTSTDCMIKYAVYCDQKGLSLASENEIPKDDNNTPGGNGDTPGGNGDTPGGNGDTPGGNGDEPGGNGDNPGGNGDTPGGNGDEPGGNGDTPNPAENFELQSEGSDIALTDKEYVHFTLDGYNIGIPGTGTIVSLRNEYPQLRVNSFYAGSTLTPYIAYVGTCGGINEIPYYDYYAYDNQFNLYSDVRNNGGYIVEFEVRDAVKNTFIQYVMSLYVKDKGNGIIAFSYRLIRKRNENNNCFFRDIGSHCFFFLL